MRLINISAILALMLFINVGCSTDLEMPGVLGVSAYTSGTGDYTLLRVTFSEPMDRASCESSFSLTCYAGSVSGTFTWDSSTSLIFNPSTQLVSGTYYTLTISRNAADTSGNRMKMDYIYSFFAGSDTSIPNIVSVDPAAYEPNFSRDGSVTVVFSEVMDRASVEGNIKIYPSHSVLFNWTNDMTVTVAPIGLYDFMTDYIITVGTGCKDMGGNQITAERKIYFTAGAEFTRPSITGLISIPQSDPDASSNYNWVLGGNYSEWTGVGKDAVLQFTFSKAMDRQSFSEALSFSPSLEFSISWDSDTAGRVYFTNGLAPEARYELKVSNSLSDIYGNQVQDPLLLFFTVDSDNGAKPFVDTVLLLTSGPPDDNTSSNLSQGSVNNIPITNFTDGVYNLQISFSEKMDQVTVHEKVSIEKVNGLVESSPSITEYEWDDTGKVLRLDVNSIKKENLYKFTVFGGESGVKSTSGSPMESDLVIYFTIK